MISAYLPGGQLCGDWENASLSDLRLLRHAIKQNWPVPHESRDILMAAVFSRIHREDRTDRLILAACEVAVAAEEHNLWLWWRIAAEMGQDIATVKRLMRRMGKRKV